MNDYSCTARLTKNVELRYTPNGVAVATIGIAINTGWGDKQETCFMNVVAWKKLAESANTYLSKGSKVAITGRLQQREWENQEGKKIRVIEIVAQNIEFLDPKKPTDPADEPAPVIEEEAEEIVIPDEEQMF